MVAEKKKREGKIVCSYVVSEVWPTVQLPNILMYKCIQGVPSLLFSTGQTAVKLSGTEAVNRAQCAAPGKPIGYGNLLVVFANLKRVIQCACFKSLCSRKGTPKCNLRILAVAQHLPRKWRLVSSSSLQRGHNGCPRFSSLIFHVFFMTENYARP